MAAIAASTAMTAVPKMTTPAGMNAEMVIHAALATAAAAPSFAATISRCGGCASFRSAARRGLRLRADARDQGVRTNPSPSFG